MQALPPTDTEPLSRPAEKSNSANNNNDSTNSNNVDNASSSNDNANSTNNNNSSDNSNNVNNNRSSNAGNINYQESLAKMLSNPRELNRKISHDIKRCHLQSFFWPALYASNSVLPRANPDDVEKWQPDDMEGMIAWYRRFWHQKADGPEVNHSDGMWCMVLETSPWFDWPEFRDLRMKIAQDDQGNDVFDENGNLVWVKKDPVEICTPELEAEFIDRWKRVANTRRLRLFPNTVVPVLPFSLSTWIRDYAEADNTPSWK